MEKFSIELKLNNADIVGLYDLKNRVELKNFHDRLLENSVGKIYVLHLLDEEFEYIGNTIGALNSVIPNVLNSFNEINANFKLYNKINLSCFCIEKKDIQELDCIAAELICLIKRVTEKWPSCQSKMHFNNNFPDAKYSAQKIFEEIYSFKMDSIFEMEFYSGGLRGDPYLWKELVDRLKMKPVPKSIFLFYKLVNDEITDILGQPLEKGKEIYVRRFESHGSSSGYVSCDFWIENAIPELLQLFAQKCII